MSPDERGFLGSLVARTKFTFEPSFRCDAVRPTFASFVALKPVLDGERKFIQVFVASSAHESSSTRDQKVGGWKQCKPEWCVSVSAGAGASAKRILV